MNPDMSKNPLRRKAYLAYHQDGIIDILIGATMIGFALWILLGYVLFTFISWLSFGFYVQLKNTITVPRFGYVRFQQANRHTLLAIGLAIGLVLLLLVVGTLLILGPDRIKLEPITFLRKYHVQVMSGIGAAVMAIFGLWSGIGRLTAYAVVLGASMVVSVSSGISGGMVLLVTGGMILLIGLYLLLRFIRQYPAHPTEANSAS